ncbi:MAG: aminotransferase class IV [Chloroflexi bacterium]|nr:aminotransferase class IV [Chloroflexota bacterium]MBP8056714.1 aminotransferase class IV [Chloroflexota bacterium]
MSQFALFAVSQSGLQRLAVPAQATTFEELYPELDLGVYSALRTFEHNRFLDLDAHLARTYQSLRLLRWDYALDEAAFRQALHDACSQFPHADARIRYDILAAPALSLGTESRVLIALQPFTPPTPEMYAQGITLGFAPSLHREDPLIKRADFPLKRRSHPIGGVVYENLLTNEAGQVLEGTSSNFYALRDGVLYTAGDGVLEGITRQIILRLLPGLGIRHELTPIHISDIPSLDEAGISSASRALLPVVKIGEETIGTGQPGPLCQRILAAYNVYVTTHTKTAVEF